jgi:hypothetical protein
MGMASAARQQQMQPQPGQRPQLGGGKGRPNPAQQPAQQPQGGFGKIASQMGTQMGGLQPGATFMGGTVTPDTIGPNGQRVGGTMPPQLGNPMPPQLGGGKGQPGATSNVPAYAQPYIGNMMNNEQLPVPTMQPPSPLGAAAAGLGGGKGQPSQMGGLSGMSDLQRQALQQGEMTNPYIRPAAGIYDAVGREMPGSMGGQMPAPNEYSVARQPMLQPAVQPSQMPQMSNEMMQQFQTMLRGMPQEQQPVAQPVAQPAVQQPQMGGFRSAIQNAVKQQQQPKPGVNPFVSQPVQKENPRQAAQRRMQQMAAARRGMR